MSLPIQIHGSKDKKIVGLHTNEDRNGIIAFTHEINEYTWDRKFVENTTYGADLNQALNLVGGTTENIHNGDDTTYWVPTTVQGSWDYINSTTPEAGTGCILLSSLSTNDRTDIAYSGTTFLMSSFDSVSGQVQFESSFSNHEIGVQMVLSGIPAGNSVNLVDYVDPTVTASYQAFIIPKADLGLDLEELDEMRLVTVKGGGPKPDVRLDSLALISAGGSEGSLTYSATPDAGTEFYIDKIQYNIADNFTGGASYDKWGDIPTLSIGTVQQVISNAEVLLPHNCKQLSDLLDIGYTITTNIDDGANTHLQLTLELEEPLVLKAKDDDSFTMIVNDSLSALLLFRVTIIGRTRVV